jgi:hypothetical protein
LPVGEREGELADTYLQLDAASQEGKSLGKEKTHDAAR